MTEKDRDQESRSFLQLNSGSPSQSAELNSLPRLLFLCQTLPYPPHSGVQIRTFNVLKILAGAFHIKALCFYRREGAALQRDLEASSEALPEWVEVDAFPIPQEHSRLRFVWDHLRSLVSRRVYTTFVYRSRSYDTRLRDLLAATRFDLVHLDSLDLVGHLPELPDVPVVCVHHNVESILLRRRARAQRSAWRRAYLDFQARLTERQERTFCSRMALNVSVSEEDRSILERLAPDARFTVAPNGVDVEYFRPDVGSDRGLVFVGGTRWFPNRDALEYFGESILPLIRRDGSAPPVRWVGRSSVEEQREYARRYGIEMTGYVDDIRPYVRDAACYVVPLRVGGGTRLKILDAWAMGKAVVSTSVGCEGLRALDDQNILIRDRPEDFADAVRSVLSDAGLRRHLGANARETVLRYYSWDVIGQSMLRSYRGLVDSTGEDLPEAAASGSLRPSAGGG